MKTRREIEAEIAALRENKFTSPDGTVIYGKIDALEWVLDAGHYAPDDAASDLDWVCPMCGDDGIQVMDWVVVKTNEPCNDPEAGDFFCQECDSGFREAVQRKDYKLQ